MSSSKRSGLSRLMAASACLTSPYAPITSTSGLPARISATSSRAAGSSSTIRLRNFTPPLLLGRLRRNARRNAHRHAKSTFSRAIDMQLLLRSIEPFQPFASVSQPYVLNQLPVTEADPVIDDLELEGIGAGRRLDANDQRTVAVAHSMVDGVLDQWLEQHSWNKDPCSGWLDLLLHHQSRSEARGLDVDIDGKEFQLAGERDLVRRRVAQRFSQQITEPGESATSEMHITRHQTRYGVQGIEQEMWLQLQAQRVELRFGEQGLQFLSVQPR